MAGVVFDMGVIAGSYQIGTGGTAMPIPGIDTEFDVPYIIRTNSVSDNPATIYATGTLPARYTSHPDNIFATVRRISMTRDPKSVYTNAVWTGSIHYSSQPLTKDEEDQAITPLDREAKISWDHVAYQVPKLMGYRGTDLVAIVNSSGDTPDPVPEATEYYITAHVTKNVAAPPSWFLDDYCGSINTASFSIESLTVLAECARMTELRCSEKMKEGTVTYRQLSYTLEFRGRRDQRTDEDGDPLEILDGNTLVVGPDAPPPPFNLELPDMGLHDLSGTKIMTTDTPPRPVAQAVPLNGLGSRLDDPTPFNVVFLNWRINKKKDFSVLPLT